MSKPEYQVKEKRDYSYDNNYGDKYKSDRDYKYEKEPVKCEICSDYGHVNEFCIIDDIGCEETIEYLADR